MLDILVRSMEHTNFLLLKQIQMVIKFGRKQKTLLGMRFYILYVLLRMVITLLQGFVIVGEVIWS